MAKLTSKLAAPSVPSGSGSPRWNVTAPFVILNAFSSGMVKPFRGLCLWACAAVVRRAGRSFTLPTIRQTRGQCHV